MEGNRCHENVACLWDQRKKRSKLKGIATGYALNEDAMWRWHSWGLTATHVLETTVGMLRYFGMPMSAEDVVFTAHRHKTDLPPRSTGTTMSPAPCALAISHDQVVRSQKLTCLPYPSGVSAHAKVFQIAIAEQRRGAAELEPSGRDHTADHVNEQDNQADGERVTGKNYWIRSRRLICAGIRPRPFWQSGKRSAWRPLMRSISAREE